MSDYLESQGVSPQILRVQGCSTFEPIVARAYTTDSRLPNRRVEVEATTTLVSEVQAQSQPTTRVSVPLTQTDSN